MGAGTCVPFVHDANDHKINVIARYQKQVLDLGHIII